MGTVLGMANAAGVTWTTVNVSCPDPPALAAFYSRLLGWEISLDEGDYTVMRHPGGGIGLSFERDVAYEPPVWPSRLGEQKMMLHLEVRVDDLDAGLAHALEAGATLADHQPQDDVRVCLDPAGHPFCLWVIT